MLNAVLVLAFVPGSPLGTTCFAAPRASVPPSIPGGKFTQRQYFSTPQARVSTHGSTLWREQVDSPCQPTPGPFPPWWFHPISLAVNSPGFRWAWIINCWIKPQTMESFQLTFQLSTFGTRYYPLLKHSLPSTYFKRTCGHLNPISIIQFVCNMLLFCLLRSLDYSGHSYLNNHTPFHFVYTFRSVWVADSFQCIVLICILVVHKNMTPS